ncbi:MAG: peptidylprolyl isomerase [Planctomycetota bacterium]
MVIDPAGPKPMMGAMHGVSHASPDRSRSGSRRSFLHALAPASALCLVGLGCASNAKDAPPPVASLSPADFVDPGLPALEPSPERWARFAEPPAASSEPWVAPALAAKVGQINGQPVYAEEVLEPLSARLAAIGRNTPRDFDEQAGRAIYEEIGARLRSALIVAEAESSLTPQQRQFLEFRTQAEREELLRMHGQGSVAMADRVLREREGVGLEQTLDEFREAFLVQLYIASRIEPGVNVARRDIERFYRDNLHRYVRPEQRRVRLIFSDAGPVAERIAGELDGGTPFVEVASGPLNDYRRSNGGLWPKPVSGNDFVSDPVNRAAAELGVGRHAGPFEVGDQMWWVYVDDVQPEVRRALRDVQRDIELELNRDQRIRLEMRDRKRLLEQASHTDLGLMTQRVLEIARQRYGPQAAGVSASRTIPGPA